tara:strand:- start:2155 stop:3207 length:1053 start_codon:yes stop_codon:yes gene_type:complete
MKRKNLSAINKNRKNILRHLKLKNYKSMYNEFESFMLKRKVNSFLVAVSGGKDSLALTYFAKCFQIHKKSKVFYAHIDHGLRKNSSKEAYMIKKNLKKLDIEVEIIKWKKSNNLKCTQGNARLHRYKLLEKICNKKKINSILLGHHQDDLSENFFIRMVRGSGLKGLVSFSNQETTSNNGFKYFRPFLNYTKNDLSKIANNIFGFSINDPSNKDQKYLRTRIRFMIESLKKDGFDKKKFDLTLNNLISSNETINFYVKKNLLNNSKLIKSNKKIIFLLNRDFFNQPTEIVFRSFSNILKSLSKKYYPSRGKSLVKKIQDINDGFYKKTTIGGCVIERAANSTLIYQENIK